MNGNRIQIVRPWNVVSLAEGEHGDGTVYPFQFIDPDAPPGADTQNTIAKWYGVQKRWRVEGDTIKVASATPSFTFDNTHMSRALAEHETSERTLIRGIYGAWITDTVIADSPPDPPGDEYTLEFLVSIGNSDSNTAAPAGNVGNLVPYIIINIGTFTWSVSSRSAGSLVAESALTCSINGYDVVMYEDSDPDGAFTGTLTISIPPTNGFFEFRDANGANPVFDADTGAQLITPAPLN